jgi:hypothetical protein
VEWYLLAIHGSSSNIELLQIGKILISNVEIDSLFASL